METTTRHPFEKTLGAGPYAFVGAVKIIKPCENMPEGNYRQLTEATPSRFVRGMGTCAHCSHAIMNVYFVRVGNGDVYGVGCDCIGKVCAPSEPVRAKAEEAKRKMEKQARLNAAKEKKDLLRSALSLWEVALSDMPHPLFPDGSMLDYGNWMLDHAGAAGIAKAYRTIIDALENC